MKWYIASLNANMCCIFSLIMLMIDFLFLFFYTSGLILIGFQQSKVKCSLMFLSASRDLQIDHWYFFTFLIYEALESSWSLHKSLILSFKIVYDELFFKILEWKKKSYFICFKELKGKHNFLLVFYFNDMYFKKGEFC